MSAYIFTSKRLGFRNWKNSDIDLLHPINTDKEVMEFFPTIPSIKETETFIKRMQDQFTANGFCYFAVELLETSEFIGFIGLSEQTYKADFTPCVDIGWRLIKSAWNNGYATEGAKACLKYGFNILNLNEIYSISTLLNVRSQHIMKKIGMEKHSTFLHPEISNKSNLKKCVVYSLTT